jgi:hypothetical protein
MQSALGIKAVDEKKTKIKRKKNNAKFGMQKEISIAIKVKQYFHSIK